MVSIYGRPKAGFATDQLSAQRTAPVLWRWLRQQISNLADSELRRSRRGLGSSLGGKDLAVRWRIRIPLSYLRGQPGGAGFNFVLQMLQPWQRYLLPLDVLPLNA